jgi:hypothetical protein
MADSKERLIQKLIDSMEEEAIVTKFVILAEGLDPEGEPAIYIDASNGISRWDAIGLLDYGLTRARAQLIKNQIDGTDE